MNGSFDESPILSPAGEKVDGQGVTFVNTGDHAINAHHQDSETVQDFINHDLLKMDRIKDEFEDLLDFDDNRKFQNYHQNKGANLANQDYLLTNDEFNLAEAQAALKSDLLKIKKKILKVLSNPSKYNQQRRKKSLEIDSDGGFELSDDESKAKNKINQAKVDDDNKSESTNATIENVNLLLYDFNSVTFDQQEFDFPKIRKYCREFSKVLSTFQKQISYSKSEVDVDLLDFMFQLLVVNHTEVAEIELFFSFFSRLIEVSKKTLKMTQAAFSKFFFEILLTLSYSQYYNQAYDALQNCILFINCSLGIMQVDPYDNFLIMEGKRVVGIEAILHLHLNVHRNSFIHTKSLSFLNKLVCTLVENEQNIKESIQNDLLQPLVSILKEDIAQLKENPTKVDHLTGTMYFLQSALGSILQRVQRMDAITSHQSFRDLTVPTFAGEQKKNPDVGSRLMKQITLKINNHVSVTQIKANLTDVQKAAR